MSLSPGARLGVYEIHSLLGAGGMGEVYRATDSRLKRQVALKVLPSEVATDPERLARFQREAEVLAALNHPNIAHLYGLEGLEGREGRDGRDGRDGHAGQFLVMELVDGPTLADRIADGPMPIDEALPIAKQIAVALEAAHEQGIIHRDLKPANIKVRDDGTVKVLDFGLAKAIERSGGAGRSGGDAGAHQPDRPDHPDRPNLSASPTLTSPAVMTGVGVLLGTAAYMSPEQAKGKPADKRSDIWAFGVVLYEMVTGRQPFVGGNVPETLARVLEREPDLAVLPTDMPPAIRSVVRGCLQKNPSQRVRDMGDVRLALDGLFDIDRSVSTAPSTPVMRMWQRPLVAAIAGLALTVAGALVTLVVWPRPAVEREPVVRLSVEPVPDVKVSNRGGYDLAVSPDGQRMVFLGESRDGRRLYLQDFRSGAVTPLPGTEGADDPFFSADGESVGFESPAQRKLLRLSLNDGTSGTILDGDFNTRGATWGPDDTIIFAKARGLWRVPAAGGTPQVVIEGSDSDLYGNPHFLPGGNVVIFQRGGGGQQIVAMDLESGRQATLVSGRNPNYVASGHLVFVREATLMAVPFDARTLTTSGEPVAVVEGVRSRQSAAADYGISVRGTLVYAGGRLEGSTERALVWVGRDGRVSPVTERRRGISPRLSPDGERLAFFSNGDVWVLDLARLTETRIATGRGENVTAVVAWTPDGSRLTLNRRTANGIALEQAFVDGRAAPSRLFERPYIVVPGDWSRDGTALALYGTVTGTRTLMTLAAGASEPDAIQRTPSSESAPRFSPNGRWLAYVSDESGEPQVYVRGYPRGPRTTISVNGGVAPVWSRDGRSLYFADPSTRSARLLVVDITGEQDGLRVGPPTPVMEGAYVLADPFGNAQYDISRDGNRIVTLQDDGGSAPGESIRVVLNWGTELLERVPVKP